MDTIQHETDGQTDSGTNASTVPATVESEPPCKLLVIVLLLVLIEINEIRILQ